MPSNIHSRYLRWSGAIFVSGIVVIAASNFLVDPYGVWNTPVIGRLNAAKPAERDNEMMFKAADVRRVRPATLLLGSSRVDLGIDPRHPALSKAGPAYNLALMGGSMGPLLAYYKHALRLQPAPRRVVLGLDFFAFNRNMVPPPSFDPKRLERDRLNRADIVASLLTRDAVVDSFRTVAASRRDPQFRAFTQGMATDTYMRQSARELGMPQRFSSSTDLYLNSSTRYADFVPSDEAIADLAEIVRLSREHNIDLQLFIPPEHVVLQEALRVRGLWDEYWRWKEKVAALSPYWDFSGYNSITTEPIDTGMSQYWDASHFRKDVGDLILDRMLGVDSPRLPEDFGRRITPTDVTQWRADTDNAQQQWAATHGDVIKWVQDIAVSR
jgi:hypothetical protein